MTSKKHIIYSLSDPEKVYNKAVSLINQDFELEISTRQHKKYMIKGKFTDDKWIHFGDIRYQDYTYHKDKDRRNKFIQRNKNWKKYNKYTPAWLSFYLLW